MRRDFDEVWVIFVDFVYEKSSFSVTREYKVISSWTMFSQDLPNLSSLIFESLLCLPFSIVRQWSLSQSLVIARL